MSLIINVDPRNWQSDARLIAGEYVKRREASSSNVQPQSATNVSLTGEVLQVFCSSPKRHCWCIRESRRKRERERERERQWKETFAWKLEARSSPEKFVPDRWRTTYRNSSSKCTRSNGDGFLNFPDFSLIGILPWILRMARYDRSRQISSTRADNTRDIDARSRETVPVPRTSLRGIIHDTRDKRKDQRRLIFLEL